MSLYYHPTTIEVLRLIRTHGAMNYRQLAQSAGITAPAAKGRIDNLRDKELIELSGKPSPNAPGEYSLTVKGRKILQRLEAADMGDFPAPHEPLSKEPWAPKPHVSARPGADDHLRCLSRRGQDSVAHRGPISMAGATSRSESESWRDRATSAQLASMAGGA